METQIYNKINIKNCFLDWYPKREATAPSKEPWGTPIKDTRQSAIREMRLNSYIFINYNELI